MKTVANTMSNTNAAMLFSFHRVPNCCPAQPLSDQERHRRGAGKEANTAGEQGEGGLEHGSAFRDDQN
jgi:hypothetical protein